MKIPQPIVIQRVQRCHVYQLLSIREMWWKSVQLGIPGEHVKRTTIPRLHLFVLESMMNQRKVSSKHVTWRKVESQTVSLPTTSKDLAYNLMDHKIDCADSLCDVFCFTRHGVEHTHRSISFDIEDFDSCRAETNENFITKIGRYDHVVRCNKLTNFYENRPRCVRPQK